MTASKLIQWLLVAIVTPWLVFMIISVYGGGAPFAKMGESIISSVQNITLKLSTKADFIKMQADELKEKIMGKTEGKGVPDSALKTGPEQKNAKKKGAGVKQVPAKTGETK